MDNINSCIDNSAWSALAAQSSTANWFQTGQAYQFFESLPDIFSPFVYGVFSGNDLKGVCVGYVTKEKNTLKQFFTRRAIIVGGPMLSDDITNDELETLLQTIKAGLKRKAIYMESRNFNDYSRWKDVFVKNGFEYNPHLNFQVHVDQPWELIESNIGKHRRKYIRLSFRDGAQIVENPTIEQIKDYYELLKELYRTKVHMPCFPFSFFEQLFSLDSCKFILVSYDNAIVGGSVCVTLPNKAVYEWFACGQDGVYKNIFPSSVTKYAGMKYSSENGYRIFDMMGAGRPDEPYGVRDFKAEFGGTLVEHGRFKYICAPLLYKFGELGVKLLKNVHLFRHTCCECGAQSGKDRRTTTGRSVLENENMYMLGASLLGTALRTEQGKIFVTKRGI